MKSDQITILKATLATNGVATEIIAKVVASLRAPERHAGWETVTAPLAAAIRSLINSRTRWRASRAQTYGAYLQLMEKTRLLISEAQRTHASPEAARKAAEVANAHRSIQGRRPLGECRSHWSTWIPPHIREATCLAFEEMYAGENATEGRAPGRRVHPFTTLAERGDISRKWDALRKQAQVHVNAGDAIHPAMLELETRDMPEHQKQAHAHAMERVHKERYRAAVRARKAIDARKRHLTDPTNLVVPLHWTHLLDEGARERLREAEKYVGGDGYTRETYAFRLGEADTGPPAPEGRIIDVDKGYMGETSEDTA